MNTDSEPPEIPPPSGEELTAEPERATLFSWANPSPLFGGLFSASPPRAPPRANSEETSTPPAEQLDGLELEELGAAQGPEDEGATRASSLKVYGCSWRTQLKLVCWKNFLTYVRDKKTIGAYVVYPCIMCLLSFSFRRMETLPLDQETNFDYLLLAEGMILVPMLQSLALVNERRTGQRELLALHGLSPFIYRVGFLISELTLSMVMAFAICMFSLILRVMGPVESLVSFIDLFVIIVVFCISSCSLMMAMSPFFRKPMTAAMVIFILYFGSIFLFLLAGGSNEAFIHDNVGRDLFYNAETKICRDLYPSDKPLYSGVRHINLFGFPGERKDPEYKGAMRKWWKFEWLGKAVRANQDDCDDGTNETAGCSGDDTLFYCYETQTWGKCPWEINKYDLGPTNCTGLINVYGVGNVCGKQWKKITNRKKFDDRVKNGYYQASKGKTAYYTPQDEYPPMSAAEEYSLKVGLAKGETFNKNDYMLSPDWKHGRSKSGGFGICTDTCHNCVHEGYSNHKQKWMCLVPIWGLMFAVAGLKQGEAPVPLDKNLSTMLLAAFLLQIVAWYFGNVLPSDFGVRRKWNFFVSLRYWGMDGKSITGIKIGCARKFRAACPCLFGGPRVPPGGQVAGGGGGQRGDDEEKEDEPAVIVENLRKVFGGKESRPAVDNVSFKVMHSEIFALLGHNGAGKTTTISMLTGMLEPSAGEFTIHGHSLESGMSEIYKRMGLCPQHDILFEFLTAAEHVELFSRLKGAPTQEAAEKERAAILAAFELTDRADFFAYALSGGMRRKVCVALSLTGDTKFVVLDEPSAGLDPGARRRLWQTLATLKQGRSILLTTHYMDEAEILADRVSIMKDGKIACTGSPIELKEQYKCGYELVVSKTSAQQAKSAAYLEGLGVQPGSGGAVKAAEQPNNPDMPLVRMLCSMVPGARQMADHHVAEELKFELPSTERASYGAFFAALEPRKEEFGVSSYGIAMAPLEEVFVRVGCESELSESNPMQQALLAAESAVDDEGNVISVVDKQDASASMYSSFGQDVHYSGTFIGQTMAIFKRRMQLASAGLGVHISKQKDKHGKERWVAEPRGIHTILLVVIPIAATVAAFYLRRYRPQVLSMFPVKATKQRDRHGKRTKKIGPTAEVMPNFFAAFVIVAGWLFAPGFYAEVLVVERQKKIRNLMTVMGLNPAAYWLGQSAADSIFWLIPMLLSFLIFPIMDASGTVIDEWVKPSFFCCSILFGFEMQSFAYLYSFGFRMWGAASSTGPIVLLGLIIMPLVVSLLITQMTTINNRDGSSEADRETRRDDIPLYLTWSMFLDLATIVSPHGAYLSAMIYTFWPDWMADWMDGDERMRYQHGDGVREWWGTEFNKTAYARRKELYTRMGVAQKWGGDGTGPGYDNMTRGAIMSYKYTPLWGIILCQVFKIAAFSLGVYWMDTVEFREHHVPPLNPTSDEDLEALDEDVRVENMRVNVNVVESPLGIISAVDTVDGSENADDDHDDSVVVQHLRKVYPAPTKTGVHVAVKDMNFGVHEGECFGLLGPNGAGKSTTVSMLTRHTAATRGEAKVKGSSVNTGFLEAAKSLGVVTQENTLYDELSALEHLELFSKIRGVSEEHLDSTVKDALNLMELQPHKMKQSQRLSGGMKRKLCTAMSLIGNPEVVLMDEPSAGLDPVSRRNLWSVIRETMASRSVILTTHLLDEAEALCARIGIMTHGTMRCLGSAQHLRSKFGSVFELVVSVDPLRVKERSASSAREAKQAAFERLDAAVQDLFRPDDWDEQVRRRREERQAAREAARVAREEHRAEEGGGAEGGGAGGVELVALKAQRAEASESAPSSHEGDASVIAVMSAEVGSRNGDGGGENDEEQEDVEEEEKPAKLVSRHSNMLTYQVPVEFVNVGTVFDTMEARKDELCVSNYVISQPTLEQVFLSFVNEDEDGLSASNIEESIESAFDDEDRRRADAAKPRCFGLLRKTHRRNALIGCFMLPFWFFIFSWFVLMDDLAFFLSALDSEKLILSLYPIDELYTEPTCRGDLDDQDLAYFKPWSAPSLTTENRIDDDERQKTHGFATLTRNVIFPRESKTDEYCGAIVVPFAWNPNWKVRNMNLSVGVSGDFDAGCSRGKYDPKINFYACDDWWGGLNEWEESFRISVVGHNSTKIRNPYFDGKMVGNYPKWTGKKKEIRGSHWNSFDKWEEQHSNDKYWAWGWQMGLDDAVSNMDWEYNEQFTYEAVAECMPDGSSTYWSDSRQDMWTGWKFSADGTWTHDNGACVTNYRGNHWNDQEQRTSQSIMDGYIRGEQCSEVEDKYTAGCEYGVLMGTSTWFSETLWRTYSRGRGEDQETETYDTTSLCGCEKATKANGECDGNGDGQWEVFQGSCYTIVSGGESGWLSFTGCSAYCAAINATMPCIASQEEDSYVSDLRPREGESLSIDGDVNKDMQGRCTLDCPHHPSYETCAENMLLVQDNSMKYSDGRDAVEGDISLLLEPGRGAGIETCESGLQAQAVLTLQYTCDSTTPQPSPQPSPLPILAPTPVPTLLPSLEPSPLPTGTGSPSRPPSLVPTASPTLLPTALPSKILPPSSAVPTKPPTTVPTLVPSPVPTISDAPTKLPSLAPSPLPTLVPSPAPTGSPVPSVKPTPRPTPRPSTSVDCGITEPLTRDVYANVSDSFCVSQRRLRRYPRDWVWWSVALWWMGGSFVFMCMCVGGCFGMCCTKRDEEDEVSGRKSKGKYCFGAC